MLTDAIIQEIHAYEIKYLNIVPRRYVAKQRTVRLGSSSNSKTYFKMKLQSADLFDALRWDFINGAVELSRYSIGIIYCQLGDANGTF